MTMTGRARHRRRSPHIAQRTRQACENCRRKKSRCPGERPQCSFCLRLRQQCVYASSQRATPGAITATRDAHQPQDTVRGRRSPSSRQTSARLGAIESRLDQLTAALGASRDGGSQPSQVGSTPGARQQNIPEIELPNEVISDGIILYFENFCNQPCPIFDHLLPEKQFLREHFPPITLFAMLSLSLRSSSHPFLAEKLKKRETLAKLSQHAWDLLTKAYSDFIFDESYFQALCILAQVDFAEGKHKRAQTQLALGLKLAQAQGMLSGEQWEGHDQVGSIQTQEIVWTLFMLERMFISGNVQCPSIPASFFNFPPFRGGPRFAGTLDASRGTLRHRAPMEPPSIVAIYIEVIRIWESIIVDINHNSSDSQPPFWSNLSPRAAIISTILEFELEAEYHTYASVGSPMRVLEAPHLKSYFLTWLHFEIAHSTIMCCLNHPFIIYTKTRNLKGRVPLTFLQKSYKTSILYADWVSKFISEMDAAGLALHDPFIGYLVSIVTSIHIENSVNQSPTVAASARQKVEICLNFLAKLSEEWPNMRTSINTLERLRIRIKDRIAMNYVEEEYNGGVPVRSVRHVSPSDDDLSLMQRLFDFSSMSELIEEDDVQGSERSPRAQINSFAARVHETNNIVTEPQSPVAPPPPLDTPSDVFNLMQGTLDEFESIDALAGDWSLLGSNWLAYFPPPTDLPL